MDQPCFERDSPCLLDMSGGCYSATAASLQVGRMSFPVTEAACRRSAAPYEQRGRRLSRPRGAERVPHTLYQMRTRHKSIQGEMVFTYSAFSLDIRELRHQLREPPLHLDVRYRVRHPECTRLRVHGEEQVSEV